MKTKNQKFLFEITQKEYPKGLPGFYSFFNYANDVLSRKGITLIAEFWAKSFYGENNQYAAWTSGVIDIDGNVYHQNPVGGIKKSTNKITWLQELPEAYVKNLKK